jgi:uncharacterized protein (TIGR02172 family)
MQPQLANISLGEIVARGLTSEIYALGANRVLKLYFPWMRREKVEWEFTVTQALHAAGLPVPQAFEMIEADERAGIVFERIHGISMLRHTTKRPWRLIKAARQLAELHAQLHVHRAPENIPTQRSQILNWIAQARDLSAADRAAAVKALEKIQDGDCVCHGDFHPENVLMTAKGPVIIDWTTGTRGEPIGDVARTVSLLRHAEIPPDWPLHIRAMVMTSRHFLVRFYVRRYFQVRPGRAEDFAGWAPIQKAAISAWRARMETGSESDV